ncbi:helix-turn-helix domain-containing protein [Amycolatopsis lurida]
MRRALDEHALHHLHQLGIEEPLTWEPPRDWAPSLIPPGREPTDIDHVRLQQLLHTDGLRPSAVADALDAHIDHVRLAVEALDHTNFQQSGLREAQARQRRQDARTVITLDFLHQHHRQQGKQLRQITDETGIPRHIISEIATELGYPLNPGRRQLVIDEHWLREQYLDKKRSFLDIAAECGVTDTTVIGCASEYGIPSRTAGITSHPQMITTLPTTLHRDIRRAVEGGLHGWQRLHRFRAIMAFSTIDATADHLNVNQATLVRQLKRLEIDIGAALYHRATIAQPMRPHPTRHSTTARTRTPRHPTAPRHRNHPRHQSQRSTTAEEGLHSSGQLPRKPQERGHQMITSMRKGHLCRFPCSIFPTDFSSIFADERSVGTRAGGTASDGWCWHSPPCGLGPRHYAIRSMFGNGQVRWKYGSSGPSRRK